MRKNDIASEFDLIRPKYVAFSTRIQALISDLLSSSGLRTHSISARAKAVDSLAGKAKRREAIGKPYASLADIKDLAGVRVITYLESEVAPISEILEREFRVDWDHSVDKALQLEPDRFGYLSVHYVLSLSSARASLREYRPFDGFQAEVQVRSILQHAWAEIEHDLGYKGAYAVPSAFRRRFSRLAGLLELADGEFCRLDQELVDYRRTLSGLLSGPLDGVEINSDSISAFITTDATIIALDTHHAACLKTSIDNFTDVQRDSKTVAELESVGLKTLGDVQARLRDREEILRRFAEIRTAGSRSKSPLRPGISLLNLIFAERCEREGEDGLARHFEEFNYSPPARRTESASSTYAAYLEAKGVHSGKRKRLKAGTATRSRKRGSTKKRNAGDSDV